MTADLCSAERMSPFQVENPAFAWWLLAEPLSSPSILQHETDPIYKTSSPRVRYIPNPSSNISSTSPSGSTPISLWVLNQLVFISFAFFFLPLCMNHCLQKSDYLMGGGQESYFRSCWLICCVSLTLSQCLQMYKDSLVPSVLNSPRFISVCAETTDSAQRGSPPAHPCIWKSQPWLFTVTPKLCILRLLFFFFF